MSPADPRLPSDEPLTRILSGLVGGKGISDLRILRRDVNSRVEQVRQIAERMRFI